MMMPNMLTGDYFTYTGDSFGGTWVCGHLPEALMEKKLVSESLALKYIREISVETVIEGLYLNKGQEFLRKFILDNLENMAKDSFKGLNLVYWVIQDGKRKDGFFNFSDDEMDKILFYNKEIADSAHKAILSLEEHAKEFDETKAAMFAMHHPDDLKNKNLKIDNTERSQTTDNKDLYIEHFMAKYKLFM